MRTGKGCAEFCASRRTAKRDKREEKRREARGEKRREAPTPSQAKRCQDTRQEGSTRLTTHSTTLGVSLISNTSAVSTRAWGGTPSLQQADKKFSMFSI